MDKGLIVNDGVKTLVPAGLKAISYKVIDLFGDMYVFLETNCGSTLLFKGIQCFKPSENVKEMFNYVAFPTVQNLLLLRARPSDGQP